MKAAVLCVLALAGLAPSAVVTRPDPALCTAPPIPGATTRTVPDGHAKPSALAPHPRSRKRAYGAPIPPPIVAKHARRPRHAGNSPPR